jgi:hypothetical protein
MMPSFTSFSLGSQGVLWAYIAEHGRADGLDDVVVAEGDVGDQRPEHKDGTA